MLGYNRYFNVIAPGVIRDNAAFTANVIDTAGASEVTILFQLGATDIPMTSLRLQSSDTNGSGWVDVPGLVYGTSLSSIPNADGTYSVSTLPSATDDNRIFVFHINNMSGIGRFLNLVATAGDGATGTYASAVAILGKVDSLEFTQAGQNIANLLAV